MLPKSPPVTSPTSLTSPTPTPWWRGSSPSLDYGLVAVSCSIYLYAMMFRCHMSCPTWLCHILCNYYVVDPYFIRWSMSCDTLLCSWCMIRCILLPRSLLLVLIQLVCEIMMRMVCIRLSNLVVVVNCDSNFMTCYGAYQFRSYLTRDKKNACAIFISDSWES
jgi:hypothetical protein